MTPDLRLEQLVGVVGLYLNPPEKAIVLSMDEKSQIQALDRTQASLPMKKGRAGTMTHDYKRHGMQIWRRGRCQAGSDETTLLPASDGDRVQVTHGFGSPRLGRARLTQARRERWRSYGRAPERGELRGLALENRRAKQPTTRTDLQQAWADTGHRHGFAHDQALQLLGGPERTGRTGKVEDRIEAQLTQHRAVFDARELRTVALEQTAGQMVPDMALGIAREMVRDRRILTLEDGRMTTLAVRAREQAIERRATALAQPAGRDAGEASRESAVREVAERIAAPLSAEQHAALQAITGPERLAVLIGPAGTGKGIVIDAAARAEEHVGRAVLGIAVSGSTAERLGTDTPALNGRTLTLDSLVARARTGSVHVDHATTIFLDEAGMADHQRLDALTALVERSGAKLIAVGDGKQLPSIGPGGMFDRLSQYAATAELRTSTEPTTPTSDAPGKHSAPANQSEQWRTTYYETSSTSRAPATWRARPPCNAGTNSPNSTACER